MLCVCREYIEGSVDLTGVSSAEPHRTVWHIRPTTEPRRCIHKKAGAVLQENELGRVGYINLLLYSVAHSGIIVTIITHYSTSPGVCLPVPFVNFTTKVDFIFVL